RAFRARDTAFCLIQRTREIDLRETARGRFHVVLPLLARRKGRRQVPLALFCDRWQEEMFLRHPNAVPRRAVLLRRGPRYALHVVFAFQVPDPPDAATHVLGIYPGIDGRIGLCLIPVAGGREVAWSVEQKHRLEVLRRVAGDLRVRQRRGSARVRFRRREVLAEIALLAVRQVVDAAAEHGARLVLPDLTGMQQRLGGLRRVAADLRVRHRGGSARVRFRRREVLAEIAMLAVRQVVDAAAEHGARLVLPDLTGMQQRMRDRTVRALVGSWNYRMI